MKSIISILVIILTIANILFSFAHATEIMTKEKNSDMTTIMAGFLDDNMICNCPELWGDCFCKLPG